MTHTHEVNYDEARVPAYTLPSLLQNNNASLVKNAAGWSARREEILELYRESVFGHAPTEGFEITAELRESGPACAGAALRKQIDLQVRANGKTHIIPILIYVPVSNTAVPVFMGLNFHGNHTVDADPHIFLTQAWVRQTEYSDGQTAAEKGRGTSRSRWPVADIIKRGYGLVTAYYGDIDPDFDDGFTNGVHALFNQSRNNASWGSIAAWSWGLRRVMDYCEIDAHIDHKRVAVIGHSRLGKTSLWAGAQDERFALVISNNSGCSGAALSRRCFGETIAIINRQFPHWFCLNHRQYNHNEAALPVDQHMLIALQAPRPVYVASAVEDTWADPNGEFLSAYHAGVVYELLGKTPLPVSSQPPVNQPVHADIAYHVRSGVHDVTSFDWQAFMDFADRYLK